MIDIKELEQFESQLPHYGELLMKILLRKPKDKEFIIEKLLVYLKQNPEVQVLSVRQIDEGTNPQLRFLLEVKFKCSQCKQESIEETNLMCFWSPAKSETKKPVCDSCMERYHEYAQDAAAEAAYEEKEAEREEELKSLPIIEEKDLEKHGKNIK